ncbi:MAG: response regulator [Pseudomonadota bacterium]
MLFRTKLSLAFASILVLTIIVAFTSIYGMRRALAHQKELYAFTHQLETQFKDIAWEQHQFIRTNGIDHSRAFFELIRKIHADLSVIINKIQDIDQKYQVEQLLSALTQYEKSFGRIVQTSVDMETMKSRLLHESRRLISNVNAIEQVGDKAIQILKLMNETLVAEKKTMMSNVRTNVSLVFHNTNQIILLAEEIKQHAVDGSIKLYAFRIKNIAGIYQSVFKKYVYSYDQQAASNVAMTDAYEKFETQLAGYIDRVFSQEEKLISFLQQLVMAIAALAIGLGGVAIASLSKRITTPIKALNRSAQQILSGDFTGQVQVSGKDEIAELGRSFNEMSKKLAHSFKTLSMHRNHLEELVRERTGEIEAEMARHRETQSALEKEKNRAFQYFEMAGSIYLVLNPDASVALINKAGRQVLGYSGEDIIGRNWFDFIPEEDREKTWKMFSDIMDGCMEPVEFFENTILTRQGEKRTISWHNSVLKDENEKVLASLSSGEDTTDVTRMEKERELLEEQLVQARKMEAIGTLAGGIAHDFNNILYPMIGYTEMAISELSTKDPVRDYLTSVLKGALRARELVKQILTFSRKKQLTTERIRIQPIVKEALKLLRSTIPQNIAIESMIDDQTISIMGDPTRVYEIIMNLCTNAYHAMETTGGSLMVKLYEQQILENDQTGLDLPPGEYCVISVGDTGHGIDKTVIGQIFEPYFTTKAIGKGSGLGLAVTHGIVTSCGGTIRVNSEIGTGTIFEVFLPGVPDSTPLFQAQTRPVKQYGMEQILFVDDESDIVEMGIQTLMKLGYIVTGKTDSIEAFAAFETEPERYDLLVTDMTMPGMMGTDLIRKVRRIRPDFPVIICTGFSELMDEERAKDMGIQGYFKKPVLIDELSATIRAILDHPKTPGLGNQTKI